MRGVSVARVPPLKPGQTADCEACNAQVCAHGAVTTLVAQMTCTQCPPGQYSHDLASPTGCTPCAAGSFASAYGGVACTGAPASRPEPGILFRA